MGFLDRLFRSTPRPMLRGVAVELHNSRADIASEDVLARLDEALALIEQYAPRRWRHLQRDARMIRVERFPTRGAYFPADRVILTELTFLARRDITAAPVASSILHEGVHARVHAMRTRVFLASGGSADMSREERLCRRAELAFGRALPAALGAPVIERAEASLALEDQEVAPAVDWRVAMERQAEIDRQGR